MTFYQQKLKEFREKSQYTFSRGGFHLIELPDGVNERIESFLSSLYTDTLDEVIGRMKEMEYTIKKKDKLMGG